MEQNTGKTPPGKPPEPSQQSLHGWDQYNFTDPESRNMKVRGDFKQNSNAQAAVEVGAILIVGQPFTHQANDKRQLVPTLAAESSGRYFPNWSFDLGKPISTH